MLNFLKLLRSGVVAFTLSIVCFSYHLANVNAADLQYTSLGCETIDDMHLITKLAASNDVEALEAAETKLIASGKCITLKKGTNVKLITSVRAHAPGTNLLYSLAKVELSDRQVYIHRQNLAP